MKRQTKSVNLPTGNKVAVGQFYRSRIKRTGPPLLVRILEVITASNGDVAAVRVARVNPTKEKKPGNFQKKTESTIVYDSLMASYTRLNALTAAELGERYNATEMVIIHKIRAGEIDGWKFENVWYGIPDERQIMKVWGVAPREPAPAKIPEPFHISEDAVLLMAKRVATLIATDESVLSRIGTAVADRVIESLKDGGFVDLIAAAARATLDTATHPENANNILSY